MSGFTVSLMAEAQTDEQTFEDVILGTYGDKRAAMNAARRHVRRNPDSQAEVIAAVPTDPHFRSWEAMKALIYIADEMEGGGLVEESFS